MSDTTQVLSGTASEPHREPGAIRRHIEQGAHLYGANEFRVAEGLGWLSVAVGIAELSAPGSVARLAGLPVDEEHRRLLRIFGIREIASGLAVLARPTPSRWLWVRLVGDALDVAAIARAMGREGAHRARLAATATAVVGLAAVDLACAQELAWLEPGSADEREKRLRAWAVISVNRQPHEVYAFWRNLENLSRFMTHIESVEITGPRTSRWRARALGTTVRWDAEIVEDHPGELIAWRSTGGGVDTRGTVRFSRAPGGRGTEVRVDMDYDPPHGPLTAGIARLFGAEPGQRLADDLRRFKQVMETGEITKADSTLGRIARAARPADRPAMER